MLTIILIALILLGTLAALSAVAYLCDAHGLLGWLCFGHLLGKILEVSFSLIAGLLGKE
jgi:hypothetical protein